MSVVLELIMANFDGREWKKSPYGVYEFKSGFKIEIDEKSFRCFETICEDSKIIILVLLNNLSNNLFDNKSAGYRNRR